MLVEDDIENVRGAPPRAPLRVMQLLEVLAAAHGGTVLTRLSQQLATPKSSLLNLLRALAQAGYVEQAGGKYRLGRSAVQLGAMITGGDPLLRTVRPVLRRLARESGETAMIGIATRDGRHVMYVESVESRNALSFAVPIGRPMPLYCTGIGRVFLAHQPDEVVRRYLAELEPEAYTRHTTTRKAELKRILADVRAAGVAETHSQMNEGIDGFAAPVFERGGALCAMVAAGAPSERVAGRRREFVARVKEAGMEMSEVLGHRGLVEFRDRPRAADTPAAGRRRAGAAAARRALVTDRIEGG